MRRLAATVHLVTLGLWLAVLASAGVMAALAFPTLKELSPALEGFDLYDAPHWPLAAGTLAERGFTIAEWATVPAFALTVLTLPAVLPRRSLGLNLARVLVIAGIAGLGWKYHARDAARFDDILTTYRDSARAGDMPLASASRLELDSTHDGLALTYQAITGLVLVLFVLSAFAATHRPEEARGKE